MSEIKNTILDLISSISPERGDKSGFTNFLIKSDFFHAPASTDYHLSIKGGLAIHSLSVYNTLKNLTAFISTKFDPDTLIISGLFHDLCKVNFYKDDFRWKKDEKNQWIRVPYYSVEDLFPLGHGEKSVIILQKYFKLTDYEIMAIRWHMGAWDAQSYQQQKAFHAAVKFTKLLPSLMIADQLSTYFFEDEKEEKTPCLDL